MPESPVFGRILTAMVTPMRSDGSLDADGIKAVARHLVANGHDGIVVNGTTGESATLTDDESIEAVRLVVEEVGSSVPVTAGVGSNDTRHSIEMTARAKYAGAAGLLLVMPYYNKPTQPGVIAHCRAVADSTDLPIMIYDVPHRTGMAFATDTIIELAKHPQIQALKDAKGDLWATTHVQAATDLHVYSGDDVVSLAHLAQGAVGVVSVVGHVAGKQYRAMLEAVDSGDLATAREIHRKLIPATDAIMSTSQGAIMVKAALVEMGVIESAMVRLPLVEGPPEHLDIVRTGLRDSGLL